MFVLLACYLLRVVVAVCYSVFTAFVACCVFVSLFVVRWLLFDLLCLHLVVWFGLLAVGVCCGWCVVECRLPFVC